MSVRRVEYKTKHHTAASRSQASLQSVLRAGLHHHMSTGVQPDDNASTPPLLPHLSNLGPPPAMPPPTHIGERGGPWDSAALDPTFHPALQTALPMTIVYNRDEHLGWLPYLLVAESTLLHRAGVSRGLGVYALTRFKGPRELTQRRVEGDEIGYYGGLVVASAPTQREADQRAQTFVRQGRQYLLTMRVQGHLGWHIVDGAQQSVLPLLHRVNDPRNTPFAPRCTVSEYGLFRAARDIPPLDWARPLSEQVASELSFEYGGGYWQTHDMLGTADLPLDVGLSKVDTLFSKLGLNIGAGESKRPRRSHAAAAAPPAPNLSAVEVDGAGTVVYVDLQARGEDLPLQALRARLSTVKPTIHALERLPLINRSRVLVEVEDQIALELFRSWLLTAASNSEVGEGLKRLLQPLGNRILLLGAHFICPRVTEYEPRILPQTPHTDVGTRGEVIAVGLHTQDEPMNTLIDTHATLDTGGEVQGGSGFRRAHTSVFAFETAAVHAGPGVPHVEGPYPRFLTSRVFFLLASADLDPAEIAKHRADNGLVGAANLTFEPPTPPP